MLVQFMPIPLYLHRILVEVNPGNLSQRFDNRLNAKGWDGFTITYGAVGRGEFEENGVRGPGCARRCLLAQLINFHVCNLQRQFDLGYVLFE